MEIGSFQVLIPFLGLVINIIGQIFSFKFFLRLNLLKSVYIGFIFGLSSVLLFEFYIFRTYNQTLNNIIGFTMINLISYSALGSCFFNFVTLGETGRRIRILRELCDLKEGLSIDELISRYNAKEIVKRRISRLLEHGQIIFKNGRYYIGSPTVLFMAKFISPMKILLLGRKN